MLFYFLIFSIAVIKLFPDTPIAKWLSHYLVEIPANYLSTLSPKKLVIILAASLATVAFVAALPAEIALIASLDIGGYMEVAAAFALLSTRLQLRRNLARVKNIARRIRSATVTVLSAIRAKVTGSHRERAAVRKEGSLKISEESDSSWKPAQLA